MVAVSWPLYYAMLYAHWVLFAFAPIVLFRAGWHVTGGVIMLLSTLMPIAGQVWFTDSDAPGLAFLLMIEAPIAGLVLQVGIAMKVTAVVNGRRSPRS
jgi:hypothetical protein